MEKKRFDRCIKVAKAMGVEYVWVLAVMALSVGFLIAIMNSISNFETTDETSIVVLQSTRPYDSYSMDLDGTEKLVKKIKVSTEDAGELEIEVDKNFASVEDMHIEVEKITSKYWGIAMEVRYIASSLDYDSKEHGVELLENSTTSIPLIIKIVGVVLLAVIAVACAMLTVTGIYEEVKNYIKTEVVESCIW